MSIARVALLLSVMMAVGSCATTSPVVPIGNGHYEIVGHSAATYGTAVEQKVELVEIASEYCSKLGGQFNIEGDDGVGHQAGSSVADNGGGVTGSGTTPDEYTTGNLFFNCQ
jgi:putative hemolysin